MIALSVKTQIRLLTLGFLLAIFLAAFPETRAEQTAADQAKKLDSLRAERKQKLSVFQARYQSVRVYSDTILNVPRIIQGKLSKGLTKTDPVEASYQFFELNKDVFGIQDPKLELQVVRVEKDQLGKMVVFKQLYNGVEVWNSMIKASFGRDGSLYNISGSPVPDIDISTTPSIDSTSAIEIAKRDLKQAGKAVDRMGGGSARLTIYPSEGEYYLDWIVNLMDTLNVWEDWLYIIDAKSGNITSKGTRGIRDFRARPPTFIEKPSKVEHERQTLPQRSPADPKKNPLEKNDSVQISPVPLINKDAQPHQPTKEKARVFPSESLRVRPVISPDGRRSKNSPVHPTASPNDSKKNEHKISSDSVPLPVITGKGQLSPVMPAPSRPGPPGWRPTAVLRESGRKDTPAEQKTNHSVFSLCQNGIWKKP